MKKPYAAKKKPEKVKASDTIKTTSLICHNLLANGSLHHPKVFSSL
jgi:hypothetical protein